MWQEELKIEGNEQISARQRCAPVPALSGRAAGSSYIFHFQFPQRIRFFFPSQNIKALHRVLRVVFSVTFTSGQTSRHKYFHDAGVCACLSGVCPI